MRDLLGKLDAVGQEAGVRSALLLSKPFRCSGRDHRPRALCCASGIALQVVQDPTLGAFAPAHRYRADVVAIGREATALDALDQEAASAETSPMSKRALPWAELLRRVFAIDILKCDQA